MSPGPNQRIDLVAAARSEATRIAIAGVAALIASPLVLAIGSVLLIGLILGPILFIAGLVAIPYGLYGVVFPMSHPALRALGGTDTERDAAIAAIESDLASGRAQSVRLASGAILSVTPRYFVAHGRDLVIARRDDLLWAYGKVTTRTRYGFTTGKSNDVCIVARRTGEHTLSSRDEGETASALALLAQASPRAFIGYRADLATLGRDRLAAQVDCIPFASDAWPGAFLAGVLAPSTFVPEPSTTARPPSNALSWTLLLGGGALAGGGLLSAVLFGWIASHPQQPDDVRFGSFCSISSVVVCFGPGAIAAAFAMWRLFVRMQQR